MFILNESEYTTTKGSKYTGDLQGAMYAVLDNTKNWNRICEAASLMELQYYNEHGTNIWAMEEGALNGFIDGIVKFLKAVAKKIQEMFQHFIAFISSMVSKDKDFVRKYQKDIMAKASRLSSNNSIEIEGYTFKDLDKGSEFFNRGYGDLIDSYENEIEKRVTGSGVDSDYINDAKEEIRASVVKETGKLDSDAFKSKLKEKIYGSEDKVDIEITSSSEITKLLSIIKDTSTNTKKVESTKKELIKNVDKAADNLEKEAKGYDDEAVKTSSSDEDTSKTATSLASILRYKAELYKSLSNDYTVAFGVLLDAYKDRNRQARAVCVKCLGLKQESASYYGSGSLLGNVTIL